MAPAGMQSPTSGHLSRRFPEPVVQQSSAASPHQQPASGQLHMQFPRQLPQAPPAALLHQYSSGQLSQHPSGQLGHQLSGQLSHYSSDHMAARQGSGGPMSSDLISHDLRGSQIALELQAAEQAQQQASAAAAADTAELPPAMAQPDLASQAVLDGLPHQAAEPSGVTDADQQTPASLHAQQFQTHVGGGLHTADDGVQQQQWQQQHQQQQQLPNVQMPSQGLAMHTSVYAPAGTSSDDVNASNGMTGGDGHLASPDIGLKLGQAHSPGLSEDALGGDQEFIDAMQAMAGEMRQSHPHATAFCFLLL